MKKLMMVVAVMAAVCMAKADVTWSWWLENGSAKPDIALGLGSRCAAVETLELSLIYNASPVKGMQWAFWGINASNSDCLLQLAPWFNQGNDVKVQLSFINMNKQSIFDWGFLNFSDKATVQLGLLNFNKNGFLPIFPFINIDKSVFD